MTTDEIQDETDLAAAEPQPGLRVRCAAGADPAFSQTQWLRLRSDLLHDWLSAKGYLGKLRTASLVVSGSVIRADYDAVKLSGIADEWVIRTPGILALIAGYEYAMSPAGLLSLPLMNSLENRDRERIAPLVHLAWLKRSGAREKVRIAETVLGECAASHRVLADSLQSDGNRAGDVHRSFCDFLEKVVRLRDALGAFQTRVQIV